MQTNSFIIQNIVTFSAKSYSIGLGKNNLDSYETSELIVSTFGIKHERYDNKTKLNNIGLIQLPNPIFFSGKYNIKNINYFINKL